jgi:tetratricopeptide (TPR) repeat protein
MTFRTRLLAGFGVVVLVPLAVFGLGIRREMSGRLSAEYERRVEALVRVIRADVARQSEGVAARLAALKGALAADNRFRVAAVQGGDRTYVLDYAGDAMRLAGLDFLQVLDDERRVVSSGHFRNEYDQPASVPPPFGPALVRGRTAEADFLALVRTDSLRLGGRRFTLVGGIRVQALGRTDEAIEAYKRAIVINAKDVWALNNLGSLYIKLGRPEEALGPIARAIELEKNVAIFHNNLGSALENTGHFAAAGEAYRAALAVEGTYGPAATNLSRVELLKDDPATQPVDLAVLAQQFVDGVATWGKQ